MGCVGFFSIIACACQRSSEQGLEKTSKPDVSSQPGPMGHRGSFYIHAWERNERSRINSGTGAIKSSRRPLTLLLLPTLNLAVVHRGFRYIIKNHKYYKAPKT
jgi:hypothetical protein